MKFARWPYGEKCTTIAELEALSSLPEPLASCEPLALFPDLAPSCPPRASRWSPEQRYRRQLRAKSWRHLRALLFALPIEQRAFLLASWGNTFSRFVPSGTPADFARFLSSHGIA